MGWRESLISAYCSNPCQVLPNPLWKTLADLDRRIESLRVRGTGTTHLEIRDTRELLVFWDIDREPARFPQQGLEGLTLALVHDDYIAAVPRESFSRQQRCFRLIHTGGAVRPSRLPDGLAFVDVDVTSECEAVAGLIRRCYDDLHPSPDTVAGWVSHPVFDPRLWIWVVAQETCTPVALGIAELDASIEEGSLEWIQVLPEYRSQGIGKALVGELLSRLQSRARFTTVGGMMDSASNPQALYHTCGFKGHDVWWILRSSS